MEILLSVIIPVYNVESYLEQCVHSVLKQDSNLLKKTEIILVDDGSQDQSSLICDRLALEYPQILVVHKENGGLSDARNTGISVAQGEYLLFLDSDDRLQEETFLYLNERLKEDADVYIGRYCSVYDSQTEECAYQFDAEWSNYQGELLLQYLLGGIEHYDWYAWLNIVKREFIVKNKLLFMVGRYFEDALWTPVVLAEASKVAFWEYPFYLYTCNRKSSITRSFSFKSYCDKLYVCDYINQLCADKNFSNKTQQLIAGNLNLVYTSLLADYWKCPREERKKIWNHILKHQDILSYSKRKVDKTIKKMSEIIGLKEVSFLLHIRSEVKNI